MEPQVDELDTLEIEIEDMEAAQNLAITTSPEGQVGQDQMKQTVQMAKSPLGQQKIKKVTFNTAPLEETKTAQPIQFKTTAAISDQEQRNSRRMNRRFRRFLKCLPVTREKLTDLRNARVINEFKESNGFQRIFTFLFCVYWMFNMTLGLFIVDEYGDYLEENFPDFTTYVLTFSLKWFTSIGLAMILILLISLGSAMQCFTGDSEEIKASMIGMAMPLYFICVTIQQVYATGYGIWFFQVLADGPAPDEPKFDQMETDCLDLSKFFFLNEVAVGAMTFVQCIGLFVCSQKSKHLREIEGEDDLAEKRVDYYKQQLEEKRFSCRPSTSSTKDGDDL